MLIVRNFLYQDLWNKRCCNCLIELLVWLSGVADVTGAGGKEGSMRPVLQGERYRQSLAVCL